MLSCPDCSPDESPLLQLAANARGAIAGLLTLMLLLVVAVVVASACLRYTRRLVLSGAVLLGAGVGILTTGALIRRVLSSLGVVPAEIAGSLARRAGWLVQGDFQAYGWLAVLFGLVIVLTESRNVLAATRNRLVPAGVLSGWGLLNVAAGVWIPRTFDGLLPTARHQLQPYSVGLCVLGLVCVVFGAALVVRVLKYPKHQITPGFVRVGKHVNRHAH